MKWCIVLAIAAVAADAQGLVIDVSQPNWEVMSDASSWGQTGQSFTTRTTGSLIGVRLPVQAARWPTSPYAGSPFKVHLRERSDWNEIVVSGYHDGAGLRLGEPRWVNVFFDEPYLQWEGDLLAFTIEDLSGGGYYGWNEYGVCSDAMSWQEGGTMFTLMPGMGFMPVFGKDMAFETIMFPEPATFAMAMLGWVGLRLHRRPRPVLR